MHGTHKRRKQDNRCATDLLTISYARHLAGWSQQRTGSASTYTHITLHLTSSVSSSISFTIACKKCKSRTTGMQTAAKLLLYLLRCQSLACTSAVVPNVHPPHHDCKLGARTTRTHSPCTCQLPHSIANQTKQPTGDSNQQLLSSWQRPGQQEQQQ